MKCLTGDETPTSGEGYIGGRSISTDQIGVRKLIGYCPQFDGILDLLSVREHLIMFATIRGVHSSDVNAVVKNTMLSLGLSSFADKLGGTLSGGNKRKLSVAIAIIG